MFNPLKAGDNDLDEDSKRHNAASYERFKSVIRIYMIAADIATNYLRSPDLTYFLNTLANPLPFFSVH